MLEGIVQLGSWGLHFWWNTNKQIKKRFGSSPSRPRHCDDLYPNGHRQQDPRKCSLACGEQGESRGKSGGEKKRVCVERKGGDHGGHW